MDTSKKRNAFSLRSSLTRSLSRIALGFFSLPTVSSLEGFFLRLFFGMVVAFTISLEVPFPTQPHPAGLAHFFDLTWLSDPHNLFAYRSVIYLLILFYVAGLLLPMGARPAYQFACTICDAARHRGGLSETKC
jgi:hypothetical protein